MLKREVMTEHQEMKGLQDDYDYQYDKETKKDDDSYKATDPAEEIIRSQTFKQLAAGSGYSSSKRKPPSGGASGYAPTEIDA